VRFSRIAFIDLLSVSGSHEADLIHDILTDVYTKMGRIINELRRVVYEKASENTASTIINMTEQRKLNFLYEEILQLKNKNKLLENEVLRLRSIIMEN